MSLNHPKTGPNNVGAYQMSGIPYVTGSTGLEESLDKKEFVFPNVTKYITFVNLNGTAANVLSASFSAEGLHGTPATGQQNYFAVPGNSFPVTLDVRCKSIFLSTAAASQWSLCAGLTPIAAADFPVLTGSNGFAGVGGAAV
jgi:hypothetical protein